MSLVAVLAMLAWAVLVQWQGSGDPLLPSISDHSWTPVRAVFVGALVALGVGMVVLEPDNELEDIFLNAGGRAATVVAFVDTPDAGWILQSLELWNRALRSPATAAPCSRADRTSPAHLS
jgi:hypothetical protein